MSDQTDTQTTEAPQTEAAEAPQGMDALMSRMDELTQTVQSLKPPEPAQQQGGLSDAFYGQEEGAQQEWDGQYDPNAYEAGQYGDQFNGLDPQAQQQAAIAEANRLIDERVQQALAPHLEAQQHERNLNQARELERQYPDLQKADVVQSVMQEAQTRAARAGQPDLIRNPAFIELVYLAQQAKTNASQQTAADGGSEAHIEGDGAVPAEPEDDFAQRVVNAGNQGNPDGFRWM